MIEMLQHLVCKVRGHRWQPVDGMDHESVCLVCLRCRENGWLISS